MRKDYREPDDYEYEPTPHDEVLEKAKQHYAARPQLDGAEKSRRNQMTGNNAGSERSYREISSRNL